MLSRMKHVAEALTAILARREVGVREFARSAKIDHPWLSKAIRGKARFGTKALGRILYKLDAAEAEALVAAHIADEYMALLDSMRKSPAKDTLAPKVDELVSEQRGRMLQLLH